MVKAESDTQQDRNNEKIKVVNRTGIPNNKQLVGRGDSK